MTVLSSDSTTAIPPLEQFVRDSVEAGAGMWDEIEPQVYDLLLPSQLAATAAADHASPLVRVTFDPEALAEHPQAQLASLGTPLIDHLLAEAVERGRLVELHLLGLNLRPHQLASSVARAIQLPRGFVLEIQRVRTLDFPQLVFWFEAEFISDQREQEILPVAVDLHYGRQVRHLEMLLVESRLSEAPSVLLPESPGIDRSTAYRIAREQVLRSVVSLVNLRARELNQRLDKQIARMTRYYDDLRQELDDQRARGAARSEADDGRFEARRAALTQERELRIAELRKKSALRAQLRLLNVLVVHQPKLEVCLMVLEPPSSAGHPVRHQVRDEPIRLRAVWDPLVEAVEAVPCAACGRPTFELARGRTMLVCPICNAAKPAPARRLPR